MTNLNGVYGSVGSGKNILAVADCKYTFKEIPIYTNFDLNLKNAELIEPEELFETFVEDKKVPIKKLVTDEAVTWLESRISAFSDLNRYLSYMISQSRKRGLNWTVISQIRGMLDLRWRGQETQLVYCHPRNLDMEGKSTDDFNYSMIREMQRIDLTMPYETAKQFFGLYDTNKTILPPDFELLSHKVKFKKHPEMLNNFISNMADTIIKTFMIPSKTLKNGETKYFISDDWVANAILEMKKPEYMEYCRFIKIRIKAKMEIT